MGQVGYVQQIPPDRQLQSQHVYAVRGNQVLWILVSFFAFWFLVFFFFVYRSLLFSCRFID